MLDRSPSYAGQVENIEPVLSRRRASSSTTPSRLDFRRCSTTRRRRRQPPLLHRRLLAGARTCIDKFDFASQITRLDRANLLYLVVSKFAEIDLHPEVVSNLEMGYLYEELIRRFSELSNETAGEHFTPREVIRLMVNLLFIEDATLLTKPGIVRTLFDPACGTGGMLSVAEDYLRDSEPRRAPRGLRPGTERRDLRHLPLRHDAQGPGRHPTSSTATRFSEDGHAGRKVRLPARQPAVRRRVEEGRGRHPRRGGSQGFAGRFGAGLPRINDGSFLFLQHMISKMKPAEEGGSRLAIVFNGSPLFTGGAGSGESEIRRWIIENDWLEAVVALPDQLFYNTGISTYFWIVTNRKAPERRGKVQLVDAREMFVKMRKSLGEKRKEISDDQIAEITRLYGDFAESERVKIFPNEAFRLVAEAPSAGVDSTDLPSSRTKRPLWAFEPWMFAPGVGPHSHLRLTDIADLRPERRRATAGVSVVTLRDIESVSTLSSGSEPLKLGTHITFSMEAMS